MTKVEYLLICLAEECGEVSHAVSKALRFGLQDKHPNKGSTNAEDIAIEIRDVLVLIEMLHDAGVLTIEIDEDKLKAKKDKVLRYMEAKKLHG